DKIMFWNADPAGHPDWSVSPPPGYREFSGRCGVLQSHAGVCAACWASAVRCTAANCSRVTSPARAAPGTPAPSQKRRVRISTFAWLPHRTSCRVTPCRLPHWRRKDSGLAPGVVATVAERCGRAPQRLLADTTAMTREDIVTLAQQ